jgi:hypothetical protein
MMSAPSMASAAMKGGGGQRIKRFNLFSDGTETDGFFAAAHNARTITHIILNYDL